MRNRKVFTLIELLLTIGISALILQPLLMAFISSKKLHRQSNENLDLQKMWVQCYRTLKKDFEYVVPYSENRTSHWTLENAILGSGMELEFAVSTTSHFSRSDWTPVQYISILEEKDEDNNLSNLIRKSRSDNELIVQEDENQEATILLTNISDLKFEFLMDSEWTESPPTSESNTPTAIRMSFKWLDSNEDQTHSWVFLVGHEAKTSSESS